jgi:hypothetical protein
MKALPSIFSAVCLAGWLCAPAPARAADAELMEYDITWVGISVGTMTVQGETDEIGRIVRSVRLWNRPWIAAIYPVNTTLECVVEQTPEGPRHTVFKKVLENDFRQDDTLVLLPDLGRAVWSNALQKTVRTSSVPIGSRDLVSFFFDLRDAAGGGRLQAKGNYQLVMDGAIHALEITTGSAERIRTPYGRMEAIPVKAVSKSPTLFSRNRPRAVWVATAKPVVLFADVESRFGAVRATLAKWEVDGVAVPLNPKPSER